MLHFKPIPKELNKKTLKPPISHIIIDIRTKKTLDSLENKNRTNIIIARRPAKASYIKLLNASYSPYSSSSLYTKNISLPKPDSYPPIRTPPQRASSPGSYPPPPPPPPRTTPNLRTLKENDTNLPVVHYKHLKYMRIILN